MNHKLSIVKKIDETMEIGDYEGDINNLFQIACIGGYVDVCRLLLENGADVGDCRELECCLLETHVRRNNLEMAKLLLEYDKCIMNTKTISLAMKNREMCKAFVENGVDLDFMGWSGISTMHIFCNSGDCDAVELLIEFGAGPNIPNGRGIYPIEIASSAGHLDIARLLIVHSDTETLGKLLHKACYDGRCDMVELLLDNGVDVNWKNKLGESSIYIAIQKCNVEIMDLLLERGVEISNEKNTLLNLACVWDCVESVKWLLNNIAYERVDSCQKKSSNEINKLLADYTQHFRNRKKKALQL